MKNQITACIDGSAISTTVCDTAAWASSLLEAPVKFLHVLEKSLSPAKEDLSGAIGLGSREHLLDELAALDQKRNKLAIEYGKHILDFVGVHMSRIFPLTTQLNGGSRNFDPG